MARFAKSSSAVPLWLGPGFGSRRLSASISLLALSLASCSDPSPPISRSIASEEPTPNNFEVPQGTILEWDDFDVFAQNELQARSWPGANLGDSDFEVSWRRAVRILRHRDVARLEGAFDYDLPALVAYVMRDPSGADSVAQRFELAARLAAPPPLGEPEILEFVRRGDPDCIRARLVRAILDRERCAPEDPKAPDVLLRAVEKVEGFIAHDAQASGDRPDHFADWALKATALTAFAAKIGLLTDRLIARIALEPDSKKRARTLVVGPGLDIANQHVGFLSPVATYQPFETAASLVRHGLSSRDTLEIETLELNPWIQEHLERAVRRARGAESYPWVLFAFAPESSLHRNDVTTYVETILEPFGVPLGKPDRKKSLRVELTESYAANPDPRKSSIDVWYTAVPHSVVQRLLPRRADLVTDRFSATGHYDIVVCTNVLRYYVEPALGLAIQNLRRVLTPGGFLVVTEPLLERVGDSRFGFTLRAVESLAGWDAQYLLQRDP